MLGFRQHLRDLGRDRGRIGLTTVGVIWGTMAVTVLVAFGESLSHTIRTAQEAIGVGTVVVWGGVTTKPHLGLPEGRRMRITSRDVEAVEAAVPEIRGISREFDVVSVELRHGDRSSNVRLSGVDPEFGEIRRFPPQAGGRCINERDVRERRRVVFLGNRVKDRVFGADRAVGKTVWIREQPFTVIGVLEPKLQMSTYAGEDRQRVLIPASTYEAMWGTRFVTNFVYRTPDRASAPAVRRRVYEALGRRMQFDPGDRQALSVWDTNDEAKILDSVHLGVRLFMGIIGAVTLVVAGVGVANIMYVLVQNRTREIGIKVALGARPGDLVLHHLLEGGIIVLLGGGLGVLFSWLMMVAVRSLPMEEEALQYFGRPEVSPGTMVVVGVLLGAVAICAGLLPARRAANVNPVEALRYE